MPVVDASATEIVFESLPYKIEGRRNRVKDRMVSLFVPKEGDYEITIYEGNGSNNQAMIVATPDELIDWAYHVLEQVEGRPRPGA